MKKTLIIAALVLFSAAQSFAQKLVIGNHTSSSFLVTVAGHNSSATPCQYVSNQFTVTANSVITFNDPTDLNNACTGTYYWNSCASPALSTGTWDGATVNDGCRGSAVGTNTCVALVTSSSFTDCASNTIYIDWATGTNDTLKIH